MVTLISWLASNTTYIFIKVNGLLPDIYNTQEIIQKNKPGVFDLKNKEWNVHNTRLNEY